MTVYKSNVAVIFFPSWWKSNKIKNTEEIELGAAIL